jgi:hypothetical protein
VRAEQRVLSEVTGGQRMPCAPEINSRKSDCWVRLLEVVHVHSLTF